jgi:aminomethyltransferase
VPDPGTEVTVEGDVVGEVTRADTSPSLSRPVALALVDFDLDVEAVVVDGEGAPVATLPFVEGSARSARLPSY